MPDVPSFEGERIPGTFGSEWRSEWMLEIACIVTYAASLVLPAFGIVQENGDIYPGYFLLVWGSIAVLSIGTSESLFFNLAWLANLAFVMAHLSLVLRRAPRACAFAAAAVTLSACFALVKDTATQGMCMHHPIKIHAGYVFWVASMVLTLASALVTVRRTEGAGLIRHHGRAALWIAFISLSYIIFGSLLPPGKCALLR